MLETAPTGLVQDPDQPVGADNPLMGLNMDNGVIKIDTSAQG